MEIAATSQAASVDSSGHEPQVLAADAPARSHLATRVREHLRNSLFVIPALCVIGGGLAAEMISEFDMWIARSGEDVELLLDATASSVQDVTAAIAGAMLTFMGVVFSLTILALQMASSQFSPRVMRTFVRSRMTKWTMGTFMATFTYALVLLSVIEPGNENVAAVLPALGFATLLMLVMGSLLLFIAYVNNVVRLLRIGYIIEQVGKDTRLAVLAKVAERDRCRLVGEVELRDGTAVVAQRSGVLASVDIRHLARLARRHDCTIEVLHQVGSYISRGEVALRVYPTGPRRSESAGADAPPTTTPIAPSVYTAMLHGLVVGPERTMVEDPAFGVRQLADIATRALSTAVNDPTTAVQAIDRLTDALLALGAAPDPIERFTLDDDCIRVVRPVQDWDAVVELAFTEIRRCGHDSAQVPRRLVATFDTLQSALPPVRHPAIERQRALLERAVVSSSNFDGDATLALSPDRSGIG